MSALREAHEKGFSTGKQFELQLSQAGRRWFELSVAHKATGPGEKPHSLFCRATSPNARRRNPGSSARLFRQPDRPAQPPILPRAAGSGNRRGPRHRGDKLAVLFMDLDGFKSINDTMGHDTGDLILQWAADRLRAGVRPSDMVARTDADETEVELARLGGDEFTVLIPNLGHAAKTPSVVAHRIRELDAPTIRPGRPRGRADGQHRHRPLPGRRRGCGDLAQACGHRDVPRQGQGPRQLPVLQRVADPARDATTEHSKPTCVWRWNATSSILVYQPAVRRRERPHPFGGGADSLAASRSRAWFRRWISFRWPKRTA